LRRYADLVVHQQLRAFATGRPLLSADQILERTAALDAASATIRRAERFSNLHWKMVYLSRNPGWQGEAVVVALEERKAVVVVPELALETRIRVSPDYSLNQSLNLAVREVDIPAQTAYFRVLG
jgi:exoribonuclease-2